MEFIPLSVIKHTPSKSPFTSTPLDSPKLSPHNLQHTNQQQILTPEESSEYSDQVDEVFSDKSDAMESAERDVWLKEKKLKYKMMSKKVVKEVVSLPPL